MGQPPRKATTVEQSQPEPRKQTAYIARGKAKEVFRVLWRPGDHESQTSSTNLFTLLNLGFDLIYACALDLLSQSKKVFNLLSILQEHAIERHWNFTGVLDILKKHWLVQRNFELETLDVLENKILKNLIFFKDCRSFKSWDVLYCNTDVTMRFGEINKKGKVMP